MLTPISRILNVWRVVSLARFSTEPKCAFRLFQNCSVTKTLRVSEFIELANVYKSYDPIRSNPRDSLVDARKQKRALARARPWAELESLRESQFGSPLSNLRIRISCSNEIRQCLWATALSLAGLVKKTSHCMWNGDFFSMLRCSYCLFFSLSRCRCHFPSFKHMTVWERASDILCLCLHDVDGKKLSERNYRLSEHI